MVELNRMFQIDQSKTSSTARILSPNPTRGPLPCLLIQSFFYAPNILNSVFKVFSSSFLAQIYKYIIENLFFLGKIFLTVKGCDISYSWYLCPKFVSYPWQMTLCPWRCSKCSNAAAMTDEAITIDKCSSELYCYFAPLFATPSLMVWWVNPPIDPEISAWAPP